MAAGDGVVAALGVGGTAPPQVSGVTDSQGNAYTQVQQYAGGPYVAVFQGSGAVPLTTADSVTATFAAAATGGSGGVVVGVPGASVLDVSVLASGSSVTPAVSGTPAQAGEAAVAFLVWANTGTAGTVSSPFTQLIQMHPTSGTYLTVATDDSPPSGVSLTASATITSASWRCVLTSFEPAGGATPVALAEAGSGGEVPVLVGVGRPVTARGWVS